jgi:hypothetical protein
MGNAHPRATSGERETPSSWRPIFPYGYPSVVEGYGGVGATLLAGFSVSLIGLILTGVELRWPGLTLCLLVSAVVFFIAAMQSSMWARQFAATPDEIRGWQPHYPEWHLYAEQWLLRRGFEIWNRRFRISFRLGILSFLGATALFLVPSGSGSAARWIAVGIASSGLVAESLWIASVWILRGSPVAAYNDQPDTPPLQASALQRARLARVLARIIVHLPRVAVRRPDEHVAELAEIPAVERARSHALPPSNRPRSP